MDCTSLELESGFANFANAVKNAESLRGVRVGIPSECLDCEGLEDSIRRSVEKTIEIMKGLGAQIVAVSLPHWKYSVASYYVIATAEASANLARFDGVRYGLREKTENLLDMYFSTREAGFGEEVKRRILLGTFVLSSGYYDAYYLRAQKARTLIRRDYEDAFKKCGIILTPVTPSLPFKFGEKSSPLQMYLSDIFTISVNLAGNCAISVPSEISPSGLPIGVQFAAPSNGEKILLSASAVFEKNREIKRFTPPETRRAVL
jgi:aspartyl-tRNA(Asn)/glutamyl-tRNA(Gln) amidotransferase subunit A